MTTTFAALIVRPDQISDRALARGFALALAGFDVAAPRLLIAPLPGAPGWSAVFYESGSFPRGSEFEEFEHASELFECELPPAVAVLEAAAELGQPDAVVYAIVYTDEEMIHDDAWRFDAAGFTRHFVHEWDEGPMAAVATSDEPLSLDSPFPIAIEGDDPEEVARAVRPHRGSTFLSKELGTPALSALMGALFAIERRVDVRLVERDPKAIEAEVQRLNKALRREDGRGAWSPPAAIARVLTPSVYKAFVSAYDWADPADPQDLYRELAIGKIEGTVRFLREADLSAMDSDPAWEKAAARGLFPIARLTSSALGWAGRSLGVLALAKDHELLMRVQPSGAIDKAGPTFGEFLRYLALGWTQRSEAEEEMIGALMLRAKLRSEADD